MKTTKKLLCTLLVALLVLASAPIVGLTNLDLGIVASAASERETSGQCGDNAYWNFDTETGVFTVRGTGDLWDKEIPIGSFGYRDSISYSGKLVSDIVIEEGITSIGKRNFNYCQSAESVVIPSTVKKIGNEAFRWCTSLKSVDIPEGVESIGDEAFAACLALESVKIPASVTSIGEGVFLQCFSLPNITVDENNKVYSSDSAGALFDKNKTVLIQYPLGRKTAEYVAPNSVKKINDMAFFYAKYVKSVVLPEGLTSIGMAAFYYCCSLESINLPESLESIGTMNFYMCFGLEEITFPKNLKTIDEFTLIINPFLKKIYIKSMDTSYGEYFGCDSFYVDEMSKEDFIKLAIKSEDGLAAYGKSYGEEPIVAATIYCHAGSTAEAYAKENNAKYVLTHFYEGDWTYDKENSVRYRKCINCDEIEIEHIEDEPQEDISFFQKIIDFFRSIFEKIKNLFK